MDAVKFLTPEEVAERYHGLYWYAKKLAFDAGRTWLHKDRKGRPMPSRRARRMGRTESCLLPCIKQTRGELP